MGMVFPVAAIKRHDPQRRGRFDKTSHVDVDTVRIGARCIERLDATDSTEGMLRHACVERVGGDNIVSTKQVKLRLRHDQVEKTTHRADGAVAVFDFKIF